MGVTAGFILVSRDRFSRLRAGHAEDESGPMVLFDIDKSWFFFREVFESFGEPLDKVFEGDFLPHGVWGLAGGEGHQGYISPELSRAIGEALVYIEPEDVFARAAELGTPLDPDRQRFLRDLFFEIKIGFRIAARCHGGLAVLIG